MVMHYIKYILHPALGSPKPRESHHGQQVVVICDGVGVHIGLPVIRLCIELGIGVLPRVPNLSCELQGEHLLVSF